MQYSRRGFLKIGTGGAVAMVFGGLGVSLSPAMSYAQDIKLKWTKLSTSVCCYCAVGCGLLVSTGLEGHPGGAGKVVNVEGNPDHPVNEGSLCAKGASTFQLAVNSARPPKPLYRAPGASQWKEVEWGWALEEIAKRVKKTRDATFTEKNAAGQTVNRTEAIASLGSAALDNEECWALQAMQRALGLVYIEHQARL
jgi:formate dehydrogenase major subunit